MLSSTQLSGLNGEIGNLRVAVAAVENVRPRVGDRPAADIDLQRMAAWAMNYLIRTPRPTLNYQPIFQGNLLACPPAPDGDDPVVECDTDARMEWEWYYMRDISGRTDGRDVEAAFHLRMRSFIGADGRVWAHPGCYFELDNTAVYGEADRIVHVWGAVKILKGLAEDHKRTGSPASRELGRKVMRALKGLSAFDARGRGWFPYGMGPLRADGSPAAPGHGWNRPPAPIVESLVTYYEATGEQEALDFAIAHAEGLVENLQPGGIRFEEDGSWIGHGHTPMHAVWGVAHLGQVTGETRYLDFARRALDYAISRAPGTGWFPAVLPSFDCEETCFLSDIISVAAIIAERHPEYYDYIERYMRNYISNEVFILTPAFEEYYRRLHAGKDRTQVESGLKTLARFQGGMTRAGLNDMENILLGGSTGFWMFGCCAPEGIRTIHTTWDATICRLPPSGSQPGGVYVNMPFRRASPWGEVMSFMPDAGRVTVVASAQDSYCLRPPHWAAPEDVRAFVGGQPVTVHWAGNYVCFERVTPGDELTITYPLIAFSHSSNTGLLACQPPGEIYPVVGLSKAEAAEYSRRIPEVSVRYEWLGNMVVSVDPPPQRTPLFTGKPRTLPPPPEEW
jgi:hypothetical protein